jgi:ABC-type branched-subunit amino acid transport system permease subunit
MGSLSTSRILLIGLAAVVLASFLPLWASGYILGLLTLAYYFGVFAMAWDLLFGFAGEVNFGPTFLIGTGAYTAGILDNLYQPPIWMCLVAGALAAVAGGVVLALPALRVRGPYFGLTTLVAVLMLQNFIVVDASLTGGVWRLGRRQRYGATSRRRRDFGADRPQRIRQINGHEIDHGHRTPRQGLGAHQRHRSCRLALA